MTFSSLYLPDATYNMRQYAVLVMTTFHSKKVGPPKGNPGQLAYTFLIRILSTSFISVSIFSVCWYSSVSISMILADVWMYIARLSRWGGGGYFTRSNDFYLPSLRLEEGEGGQHPVIMPSHATCIYGVRIRSEDQAFLYLLDFAPILVSKLSEHTFLSLCLSFPSVAGKNFPCIAYQWVWWECRQVQWQPETVLFSTFYLFWYTLFFYLFLINKKPWFI